MDAVIRSAQLASFRKRLTQAAAEEGSDVTEQIAVPDDLPSPREAWQDEVEQQVRAELAIQAQAEYQRERERGYDDGYEEARTEVTAAMTSDLEKTRERLRAKVESVLSAMERAHEAALANLQSIVGEVTFAAVCRLLGHKGASHASVLAVVEQACAHVRAEEIVKVRVHPRDVEAVTELLYAEKARIQAAGLSVIPDESLQLGGCVVESASGQYDGGIEHQLRRLHAVLTGADAAHDVLADTNVYQLVAGMER